VLKSRSCSGVASTPRLLTERCNCAWLPVPPLLVLVLPLPQIRCWRGTCSPGI
jgi:hypothetical protein